MNGGGKPEKYWKIPIDTIVMINMQDKQQNREISLFLSVRAHDQLQNTIVSFLVVGTPSS